MQFAVKMVATFSGKEEKDGDWEVTGKKAGFW